MDKFIALPIEDKAAAFQEAANRRGILPIIIEKDFWVCWTLKQLFENKQLGPNITFKGGTCLSKAYHLIERFSEDIDLTISKDAPYLAAGRNPMEGGISGKERQRRIDALKENAKQFVAELALPVLQKTFASQLSDFKDWELDIDPDDADQQTILFTYPRLMNYSTGFGKGRYGEGRYGEGEIGYIKPTVRLEFGARGDIEPSENKQISPYVAENFPHLFYAPHFMVHVLSAKRTFWEKATILHALYHGTKMRDRMSRHYYDMFIMMQKGVADEALEDLTLLEKVVQNKSLMFADSKASYETAVVGSLRLVPGSNMKVALKQDYLAMNEMFIGDAPDFESMMDTLLSLEQRINSAK